MGGENIARVSAGNMRTVTVPQPNVSNRADSKAQSFERAKLMAEIEVIVKGKNSAGLESVERAFDFVEYGTDLHRSIAQTVRKRGIRVSEEEHAVHGEGFAEFILTNGARIQRGKVHLSLLGSDGQRRVPMANEEDGITGKKPADIVVSQPKLTVVIEASDSACPLGDKEPKGPIQKQRLEELLWLNIDSGAIEPGNPIFLGYRYDGFPPQYFQSLTAIEPRGFETQTGFVPAAALVQDRADLGAMAWLRVAALKADGELGIARYYDAIGERGIEQMPAKVEAAALPQAEERAFVASSAGSVQGGVQECVTGHAPVAQEAPVQFAYYSFEPAPIQFKKGKKPAETPVEAENVARTESKVERKEENLVRKDVKVKPTPSAKQAHGEMPFWRIGRKGGMKPFHAPMEIDEDVLAPMPKLKAGAPKSLGKFVSGREKKSPVGLRAVAEVKKPELLQEKKKKRRRRPEMKPVGAEKPAEKPKRPAAKVRFGDAAPLSSGIKRKKVRREMPAVELKKEKKAKLRAEKRKEIALGQDAAVSTKRKARKREKAAMLDEEAGRKNRRAEGKNREAAKKRAAGERMDIVEYLVAKRAPTRGKRKYWAPLSLR